MKSAKSAIMPASSLSSPMVPMRLTASVSSSHITPSTIGRQAYSGGNGRSTPAGRLGRRVELRVRDRLDVEDEVVIAPGMAMGNEHCSASVREARRGSAASGIARRTC